MLTKKKQYTPKEALDADPNWTIPVKLGRGRMPVGGDEHCRRLAAEGYNIKGYNVDSASTSTAPVVTKVAAVGEKVVSDFHIRYPLDMYVAKGINGKTYTLREVCNNCRVSLVQNHCDNPTILGDVAVTITPR